MKPESMNQLRIMQRALLVSIALVTGTILSGCMETTMPLTAGDRTLAADAVLKPAGNPTATGIPLPGVEVHLSDTDPAAVEKTSQQVVTDATGRALFHVTVPIAGKAFNVVGRYLNTVQRIPSVLMCADTAVLFVFDTAQPPLLDCAALNARDTLVFLDERGDTSLVQNMPLGVGRYDRCWSITNPVGAAGPVNITISNPSSPFTRTSAYVDGAQIAASGTIALAPGASLSLCFAVSTTDTGVFTQTISLPVRCPSSQGTIALTLRAHVVQPPCLCNAEDAALTQSTPIRVGDTALASGMVYTNRLSCPVTIALTSFDGKDGTGAWTVTSPSFPQTVQPGGQLVISARFTPKAAGATEDTLVLRVTPLNGAPCALNVRLEGTGCADACPKIDHNGGPILFGSAGAFSDTLFNPNDPTSNRLNVSILSLTPPIVMTVDTSYFISLADDACAGVTVDIDKSGTDTTSARFFTVSPSRVSLQPGDRQPVQITFSAPDLADFRAIIARRVATVPGPHPVTADSAFTLVLRLRTGAGCLQAIRVTAVLTPYPDLSPIINLRAYSQRTPFKSTPENEVYTFGNDARTSLRTQQGDGPFPPNVGDIYINVSDTTPAGVPPLPPILYLDPTRFSGMKLWRSGYLESDFDNVVLTVTQFFGTAGYNTGYSTTPITPLASRDVYAFQYIGGAEETYALMYIREVKNGTENNSNKQSAIEFRAIYPLVRP